MPTPRILILTASHLCRNPRVVKEAATLGGAGYDVTVLTLSVRPDFEALDRDLMSGQPFKRIALDYSSGTWRSRAASFSQRAATWIMRQLCHRLGIESAQALGPARALLRRARQISADLTIAHNEIALWALRRLASDGRRVAADLEDWYSEDLLPEDRRSRPLRLLRNAEAFALRHSAYVSTTSTSLATAIAARHGCAPPVVIRNTFPLQPTTTIDRSDNPGGPTFIWFSQTIGPGRGLEQFLLAWVRTTSSSRVCLLGHLRPGYRDTLLSLVPSDRKQRLDFLDPVPPGDLPALLAGFDIGLALEQSQPRNRDLTISNKIFQYMNAGLAVVASDTTGQREVMHEVPQCGLLVSTADTVAFAAQLDGLLADPGRLRRCQEAARAAARNRFCWERDSATLLTAVRAALS